MSHLTQMAGPRGPQLRLRRGRRRGRGRADPRTRAPAHAHARQLLGRPRAHDDLRSCCRWRSSSRSCSSARAWCRTSTPRRTVTTVTGQTQTIPGGPIASQEAIKEIGENGGGPYNAELVAPVREPEPDHEHAGDLDAARDPVRVPVDVREDGRRRRNRASRCSSAMFVLVVRDLAGRDGLRDERQREARRDRRESDRRPRPSRAATSKARRPASGPPASGSSRRRRPEPRPAPSTRSTTAITPIGGAAPLVNIMLGEVDPGGTGSGLYGMLLFALLSVFIAGLMVGRTPEYLGKKIQAAGDEARRALHPVRAARGPRRSPRISLS